MKMDAVEKSKGEVPLGAVRLRLCKSGNGIRLTRARAFSLARSAPSMGVNYQSSLPVVQL